MDDATETVDLYFEMWNEEDQVRRLDCIERCWTSDGRYADPVLEAEGHAGLAEMVARVHARFPGQRFRRTSIVDRHHDMVRFAWELGAPGAPVTVAGIDVGVLAPDGRLHSITGFFGELEAAA